MVKSSRWMKVLVLSVVLALCAGTIAVADGASVAPRILVPKAKQVITYGEASSLLVKAIGGSFDGTLTVYKSVESSAGGFASILSTRTVSAARAVNNGKLHRNTWFYASYLASGAVEATVSPTVMIGVKAKLGTVSYRVPGRVGRDKLNVSGSVEVTPAVATTANVALQKFVKKTTFTSRHGRLFRSSKWVWETIASKDTTLTKDPRRYARYTFSTDFGTRVSYEGMVVRAVVSYEDALHTKATRAGHALRLHNRDDDDDDD